MQHVQIELDLYCTYRKLAWKKDECTQVKIDKFAQISQLGQNLSKKITFLLLELQCFTN